jgi:septal ring factor EnvC (AmiA/AmiB activator)
MPLKPMQLRSGILAPREESQITIQGKHMQRIVVGIALALASSAALAQQPPQKDRKDFLIEAVESQRNDALSKLAVCFADANGGITALNTQVGQLQSDAAKAKDEIGKLHGDLAKSSDDNHQLQGQIEALQAQLKASTPQ